MTTIAENRLPAILGLHKLPLNNTKYFELDQSQDWVKNLLMELNEKADEKSPEDYLLETYLNVELHITKKYKQTIGDYVLIKANIKTKYTTQCIRTLEEMFQELEFDVAACFIGEDNQDQEEFRDQTETFQENEMYELYFFEKNQIDLSEMIHEQIFLNINQYPVKNADVPLPNSGTQQ